MHLLTEEDIPLLYGSLVILPQDMVEPTAKATTSVANVPLPAHTKETTTPPPAEDGNQENIIAEEPSPVYTKKRHPFILLTTPEQKDVYKQADSPLGKILAAHKIATLVDYLSTDTGAIENMSQYECIWAIGLSLDLEKKLLNSGHANLQTSPNLLQLSTKEEKRAMYEPLKIFIAKNLESFLILD